MQKLDKKNEKNLVEEQKDLKKTISSQQAVKNFDKKKKQKINDNFKNSYFAFYDDIKIPSHDRYDW